MKTGIELVAVKVAKNKVRFGNEHDSFYKDGQLKKAAIFTITGDLDSYPTDWGNEYRNKCILNRDKIEEMVNTCALLIAEIDRLQAIPTQSEKA